MNNHTVNTRKTILATLFCCLFVGGLFSCSGDIEHVAKAINEEDSVPFMHSRGINTLISDSGVMRYHMVAEEWDIFTPEGEQATWKFKKGLLMERFDEKFHIDLYVQADTAYLHNQRMWELRGRVVIRNVKDEIFLTEELFWDMNIHEMWSYKFIRIITPERELQGTEFHSNEEMTKYTVSNSAGAFPVSDTETSEEAVPDSAKTTDPTTPSVESAPEPTTRTAPTDRKKTSVTDPPKATPENRFPAAPHKLKKQEAE